MAIPALVALAAGTGLTIGIFTGTSRKLREQLKDATDPAYSDRNAAIANYIEHIRGMGWPLEVIEALTDEAFYAPTLTAEGVYLYMLEQTPRVLSDLQISPNSLRNFLKVENWLKEAAEASGATSGAIAAITPWGLAADFFSEVDKDRQEIQELPWKWIAAGAAALLLLREIR